MSSTDSTQPHTKAPHGTLDPSRVAVDDLARLLSGGGRRVTPEQIRSDLDSGAPANADGTLNLVHFTAWLLKEVQRDGE